MLLYFAYGLWNSKLGKGIVVLGHEEQLTQTPHPRVTD
jgi:hypothetical protein